jgi:hypothetical protein
MRKVISCSISEEEFAFITDKELSASDLLQGAIAQAIENQKVNEKFLKEALRKMHVFQNLANKQRDFIEKHELMEEYINEDAFEEVKDVVQ